MLWDHTGNAVDVNSGLGASTFTLQNCGIDGAEVYDRNGVRIGVCKNYDGVSYVNPDVNYSSSAPGKQSRQYIKIVINGSDTGAAILKALGNGTVAPVTDKDGNEKQQDFSLRICVRLSDDIVDRTEGVGGNGNENPFGKIKKAIEVDNSAKVTYLYGSYDATG
ncbi:MAG: hypothetical protein LBP35_02270 [Candidatus Ancillula trichonymphae]|nr:hypothetical protein [Candidatus Ancillula trichonymphae]